MTTPATNKDDHHHQQQKAQIGAGMLAVWLHLVHYYLG